MPRLARTTPRPKPGIVHLGPGAFFRAFNAIYTADAMDAAAKDWGIVAVSLRSTDARDQLEPQGCAYTSVTLAPGKTQCRVIESIAAILVAPEDPQAVLTAMAAPETRIVSLTITEKGYCHNPATGRLEMDHPDIAHDLAASQAPRSAPGFLVEALARRRAAQVQPFTALSCDNLPSNGRLLRGVVLDFARARDPELAGWIADHVRFPSTMVDRITPATTADDIAHLAETQGYRDDAMVAHEPFRQWVIEDDFPTGRPAWDAAGAQFVRDVERHELMKLRCLNGTHSTLAYLGYLAGYATIAETVADPAFARLCERLWAQEILPTVPQPEGEDLPAYAAALLERYRNPAIRHRTWQIAMDGSQKLPQRILGTVIDNLDRGQVPKGLCLAVAGWMRYVGGVDEGGSDIDVRDPLANRLRAASDSAATPEDKVAALLSVDAVFPEKLTRNPDFTRVVTRAFEVLADRGARAAVQDFVG
ncbi:mannitol dehydrogenase family protein [Thalassococcus sp. CAU 1522]|uniref:Mannitol dehydrogenase family protein n=1 Tax=Thalassococcus arenae TaxID=2851652 RepID=A0ABS6NC20_9RHOB|nr:mannitol dehydrogenase family protein [Thalassococcus arenae]MBV2361576.1 mannitol dehydrogenase family protein [Thalassococcus arenae]